MMNKLLLFFITIIITISPIYADQASQENIQACNQACDEVIEQINQTERYHKKLKKNLHELVTMYHQEILPSYDQETVERVTNTLKQLIVWQKRFHHEATYVDKRVVMVVTKLIAKQINERQRIKYRSRPFRRSRPPLLSWVKDSIIKKSLGLLVKCTSKTGISQFDETINEALYEQFIDLVDVEDAFKNTQEQAIIASEIPVKIADTQDAEAYIAPSEKIDNAITALTQAITASNLYDKEYKDKLISFVKSYGKQLKNLIQTVQEGTLIEQGISSLEQLEIWQKILTQLIKSNNDPKLLQKIKETIEQFSQTVLGQKNGYLKQMIKKIISYSGLWSPLQAIPQELKYVALEEANKLEKALAPSQDTPITKIEPKISHTDLHKATTKKDVETFLARGDDVNALTTQHNTPLHMAVGRESLEVVKALLKDPKINVDLQNKNGEAPLHRAAELGYQEIVMALLAAKADATIKNDLELMPIDVAKTDEIKALLTIKTKPKKRTK